MYAWFGNSLIGCAHGFGLNRTLSRVSTCAMPANS